MNTTPSPGELLYKLTTLADLRAWVVLMYVHYDSLRTAARYALVEVPSRNEPSRLYLQRQTRGREYGPYLAPALAQRVLRAWPITRAGGRAPRTAMGILRVVSPADAAVAERDGHAAVRVRDAEKHRLDKLADRLEEAFVSREFRWDIGERAGWQHAPRPEFGGRSAHQAVALSDDALSLATALLRDVRAAREANEAQGWRVEPDIDTVPPDARLLRGATEWLDGRTVRASVSEHGHFVAVCTLAGPGDSTASTIVWLSAEIGAPSRLAAAAAAYAQATRRPDPYAWQQRAAEPVEAFLRALAARSVRDTEETRHGLGRDRVTAV